MSTLRDLNRLRALYTVPGDDLAGDVIIPAMASSGSVRCMAGFFHSSAFRHLAPGLAAFVNGTDGLLELLIHLSIRKLSVVLVCQCFVHQPFAS